MPDNLQGNLQVANNGSLQHTEGSLQGQGSRHGKYADLGKRKAYMASYMRRYRGE